MELISLTFNDQIKDPMAPWLVGTIMIWCMASEDVPERPVCHQGTKSSHHDCKTFVNVKTPLQEDDFHFQFKEIPGTKSIFQLSLEALQIIWYQDLLSGKEKKKIYQRLRLFDGDRTRMGDS